MNYAKPNARSIDQSAAADRGAVRRIAPALAFFLAVTPFAVAQQPLAPAPAPTLLAAVDRPVLPDAPGAVLATRDADVASSSSSSLDLTFPGAPTPGQASRAATPTAKPMASHTDKYIAPGQPVPTLSVGDKMALGVKDAISPFSFVGWIVTAGYDQATNGSPNYGTNGKAFAQRFGAAAARSASEGIFSDSIMDSVLHEDPRYYRMGPGHNFLKRAAYAATRTVLTRTDSGKTTVNFALLAGNLGGSYLTKAYYPPLNTTNVEVFKTFGGSVGGSAVGFVVSEFLTGTFNIFHSSKPVAD